MLKKIGVATSIFAQNGYDTDMTIAFAQKHDLGSIQLYMDKSLESSMERIIEIKGLLQKTISKEKLRSIFQFSL